MGTDAGQQEFVRMAPGLGGMVLSAVGYRQHGAQPAVHRGLPSPYLTLIFSLDGPVTGGLTPEQSDGFATDIVIGGLHDAPTYVRQPDRQTGVQLAVHPLAARALFGMPAAALSGQVVVPDGREVLGRAGGEVQERLREEERWEQRFDTLRGYLRRQVATARPDAVRPEVAEAWAWLARHGGAGSVGGLAKHVALSERRLTALFRAETGISPKQAARLMRFERAKERVVRAVVAGVPPDLARVAADCGYYDHSHLVRDFRQYTGVSPTGWLAEECRNIQAGGHLNGTE
ncbi:AraC family transcriptional regulator [Streptomyces sp. A7024]|uniref:AraC family transcriptional regulator n=1 Tax=Streptomyces coryli TaxID=1128680 RepID=A0A6G4TVV3_9ACTN|nr:helix-turn-helix domain-containing protein [Streptomyces coryli]NGN63943.1 AraC family transcriptional regulator [Streptomyces coryli]